MKMTYTQRMGEATETWTFEAQRAETMRWLIRDHGPTCLKGPQAAQVPELPADAKGAAAVAALGFFGIEIDHRGSEGAISDLREMVKNKYLESARKRTEARKAQR